MTTFINTVDTPINCVAGHFAAILAVWNDANIQVVTRGAASRLNAVALSGGIDNHHDASTVSGAMVISQMSGVATNRNRMRLFIRLSCHDIPVGQRLKVG